MKKIEATIPPFTLEEVRAAFVGEGAEGMTVTEVRVLDPHIRTNYYRGSAYDIPFVARCKVEVVIADEQVARCVDAARAILARTDDAGQIVVLPLGDTVRIRTGEHLSRAA